VVIVSQRLGIGQAAEHLMWTTTEAEEYADLLYEIP
jgi:hypothetical protein